VYNFLITFKEKSVGILIPTLNNSLVISLFDQFSKSRNSNDNIEESTTSAKDTIQHNTSDHASINTTSQGTSVTDNMTLMMTAFNAAT
jgi:beta-lactamase regulating signal transducer with metallopeptidase domain